MRVLRSFCVLGAFLFLTTGIQAIEPGQSGIGFFGSAHVPVFQFGKWYSASPKFGASYNYVVSKRVIAEVEYHYSTMSGGDLDSRTFFWSVDKREHRSPNVKQDMSWHSFAASGQLFFGRDLDSGGALPYLAGGAGFFRFSQLVSGLTFPGQTGVAIDPSIQLEPYQDEVPALTFTLGGGVSFVTSDKMMIDLRLRYNIVFGELRPLEDWGLQKAFPMQAVDVLAGVKFFF